MSQQPTMTVICPACGTRQQIAIFPVIDVKEQPELKIALQSGQLFLYPCTHCGHPMQVEYPCLYIDADQKKAVYLQRGEGQQIKQMEEFCLRHLGEEYTLRLVPTANHLAERVLLWERGLDDRLVELMKEFYLRQTLKAQPQLEIDEVYLEKTEHGHVFCYVTTNGEVLEGDFPADLYEYFAKAYGPWLESQKDLGHLNIGKEWRKQAFSALEEK